MYQTYCMCNKKVQYRNNEAYTRLINKMHVIK